MMKRKKSRLKEGDLVEVLVQDGPRQWTLCGRTFGVKSLIECISWQDNPDLINDPAHVCMQGQLGLITQVVRNKLSQPLIYELNFSNEIYYCKALLAEKYLRKI